MIRRASAPARRADPGRRARMPRARRGSPCRPAAAAGAAQSTAGEAEGKRAGAEHSVHEAYCPRRGRLEGNLASRRSRGQGTLCADTRRCPLPMLRFKDNCGRPCGSPARRGHDIGEGRWDNARIATLVGVVMGSQSDWDVMQHAAKVLKDFGVAFETKVVSAHRTPDAMFEYAEDSARARAALHRRRCRRRGTPAGDDRLQDLCCPCWAFPSPRSIWRARTPSTPSCRCPRASPWPPSPSARPAPPTRASSP